MAGRFLQCRVDDETRARAEKAAADWRMPVGTWLRGVVDAALEAHEDVELIESRSEPGTFHEVRRVLGTCSCKGFVNAGHCWHLDGEEPVTIPESGISDGYLEDVEAAAAELRDTTPTDVLKVEHPDALVGASSEGPKEEPPEELEPRDCPHHPAWRSAGRCSRCGSRVGRGAILRR